MAMELPCLELSDKVLQLLLRLLHLAPELLPTTHLAHPLHLTQQHLQL